MKVFALELSFECHGTLGREAQGREAQGREARELLEKVLKVISGGSSAHWVGRPRVGRPRVMGG